MTNDEDEGTTEDEDLGVMTNDKRQGQRDEGAMTNAEDEGTTDYDEDLGVTMNDK